MSEYGRIHGILLTIAWLILQNLLIWAQNFKHIPYSVYIHSLCGLTLFVITFLAQLLIIIPNGMSIITSGLHQIRGIIVLVLLFINIFLGLYCRYCWSSVTKKPKMVSLMNIIHPILGWIIILFAKYNLYTSLKYVSPSFYKILIGLDIASHIGFLIFKFLSKTMQSKSINQKYMDNKLRRVTTPQDLDIYGYDYIIFANLVYPTHQLQTNHPGGHQIIQQVKTRDVDRFIYGSDPIEIFSQIKPRAHSYNCLNLLNEPIANIKISNPYRNMYTLNEVKIHSQIRINTYSDIYTVYLADTAVADPFQYRGYNHLNQLGRYYAVTGGNKKTRLYSVVNCLRRNNIDLMNQIWGNFNLGFSNVKDTVINNAIPIMVKKYKKSSFPNQYLTVQNTRTLYVSEPRAFGLALQEVEPGDVMLFSGGTGLHPYCDLIDLLYKDMLIQQHHPLSQQFMIQDPILQERQFNRFKLSLVLGIRSINQIHPLTLFQIRQLCKSGKLNAIARISEDSRKWLSENHPYLLLTEEKFQNILKGSMRNPRVSKILLCGPVRMTRALVQTLRQYEVPWRKYRIL